MTYDQICQFERFLHEAHCSESDVMFIKKTKQM